MKKPLLILLFALVLIVPGAAFAANGAAGDACTADTDCDGQLACISGKCAVDPNLDSPAATAGGSTGTNAGTAAKGSANANFVPLTSLPGLKDSSGATSLPVLLSNIYKICIGLAASLAILQLIRAGVLYMGGDSITEKKEARDIIGMSIAGLLLVLSPTIVFGIINPNILKLDLTTSLSKLSGSGSGAQTAPASGTPGDTATECAAGSNYVPTFGIDSVPRCVDSSGHDCPVGQGWDPSSGACSTTGNSGGSAPQCPTGSNYVVSFGIDSVPRCVDSSGHDCPVGQGWSTSASACTAAGTGG